MSSVSVHGWGYEGKRKRGKSDDVNGTHFGANSCVCVCSCMCGSMVAGAWLMVGALQQVFEYYYY